MAPRDTASQIPGNSRCRGGLFDDQSGLTIISLAGEAEVDCGAVARRLF
jgi:hypothetical protein